MATEVMSEAFWSQVSERIALHTGLNFPPERHPDLKRALLETARETGMTDTFACADRLLSSGLTGTQLQVLITHLTIGETYFFRDSKMFAALSERVIPDLMRARSATRTVRVWSAACCTGEEAYSLAILLRQQLPDREQWHLDIRGTDINEMFLRKAVAGVYGEWSFRNAPVGFKERYFTRGNDGCFTIAPEIQRMVRFTQQNLVDGPFDSLVGVDKLVDLIFCRNALMYFTASQARKVVLNLRRVLADDGWMVAGPTDGSQLRFEGFAPVTHSGTILYRKKVVSQVAPLPVEAGAAILPVYAVAPAEWNVRSDHSMPNAVAASVPASQDAEASLALARRLHGQREYHQLITLLLETSSPERRSADVLSLLTRAYANLGRLHEALVWCDQWIAADRLDAISRYLKATILQELGDVEGARRTLKDALYLQPDLALAHVSLGNLARIEGKRAEAARHFANALASLRDAAPEYVLPETEGLTVGGLRDVLASLNDAEVSG